MTLNNCNSNNRGWGKVDNSTKMFLVSNFFINKLGENFGKEWGELQVVHNTQKGEGKLCGKPQAIHRNIHKFPPGLKIVIHMFSPRYPQPLREVYEI
jgi:hypothetical protein